MLIELSVSNFLSFNSKETFSMIAGKARKNSDRIFVNKKAKLTKCQAVFGANASGKSNLIKALELMKIILLGGNARSFTNKYYRINPDNRYNPSTFEVKIFIDSKILTYGFSIILFSGQITREYLYENINTDAKKTIFNRIIDKGEFEVGSYFKRQASIVKLENYGDDSSIEMEKLFLSIINQNKNKMFDDLVELQILQRVYNWFADRLDIRFPDQLFSGYPYFSDSNLEEITHILNALGTGISDLKIIELTSDTLKSRIPIDIYNNIISDLENLHKNANNVNVLPKIFLRKHKELYTFEIDSNGNVTITTIEFSHENNNVYFDLNEESDGTTRLLDIIEVLFSSSDNHVYLIDEIDRCLHPTMTIKFIEMFLLMAKNRNTQLIISSHESRLLDNNLLRNDEICFIVKSCDGSSVINSLDTYQLRADKKISSALFDGTINAIPNFNETKLQKIIGK